MIIFPAIDLRGGRCVRLLRGDPAQETHFSDDPVATARGWVAAGARWLHVVDLDGALGEPGANAEAIERIVDAVARDGVRVQVGGGLRDRAAIDTMLARGAARVILGTAAIREPALLGETIARHGAAAVVAALDAREGLVAIEGWQETSARTALDVASELAALGLERVLYTDIHRDGTHEGPNVARTGELAQKSGLAVIASGGVGSLDHLRQLRWIERYGVEGVVVGRALYEGRVDLTEAIALLAEADEPRLGSG